MAAAYNLLVNFQVMNHTYIFRSSIGCCCSIPTAWSEELESLLIIVQLCILYFNLYLYFQVFCAVDREAKNEDRLPHQRLCDRHFGIAAVH